MKKLLLIILFIFLVISCSEDFEPYGNLQDDFVLNCIIKGDTSFQTLTLAKSYLVNGMDPYSSTTDPNVYGAVIHIWNGDSVAIFRDTLLERPEGSKFNYPYQVYYTTNFKPNPAYPVEIEARLTDGRKVKSSSIPPKPVAFTYIEKTIPVEGKQSVRFSWNDGILDQSYITKLSVNYIKYENGVAKNMFAEIPLEFVKKDDNYVAINPSVTNSNVLSVNMETVTRVMESISAGDDNKENYEIHYVILQVLSLDKNLSAYYNSTARNKDAFSVKLDETDYSNIAYGLGVYLKGTYSIPFKPDYIRSFGYKLGPGYVELP